MKRVSAKLLLGLGVCFFSNISLQATSNKNMVNTIMKLRGEVESLYSTIDENKESYKSQIKSLMMQKADTEAQINRKDTTIKLLDSEIDTITQKVQKQSSKTTSLKPMLDNALNGLETLIKNNIPFKVEERLADVQKIKDDLKAKNITQEKALALVWASYDDALRLTKEIGLFKQQITLNGEAKMAKIAKLGSLMMFFSTPDNKVGYVVKEEKNYNYKIITDELKKEQIVLLFDTLQKQIRTGYFSLPNALLVKGVK